MAKKQYCSVCTRSKAGHPLPFGKNCKMPPLPPEEIQKNLAEQQKEALEVALSDEEEGSVAGDSEFVDTVDSLEEQERELIAMKEKMIAEKDKMQQRLESTKKAKVIHDRIQALREEMNALNGDMQNMLKQDDGMRKEMAGPPPPLPEMPVLSQVQQQQHQSVIPGIGTQQPSQQQGVPGQQPPHPQQQQRVETNQQVLNRHLGQQQQPVPTSGPSVETMYPVVQQPGPTVHTYPGARPKQQPIQPAPPPVAPGPVTAQPTAQASQMYHAALDPSLGAYANAYTAQPRTAYQQPGVHAPLQAAAPVYTAPGTALPGMLPPGPVPAAPGVAPPGQALAAPGVNSQSWMQQQPLVAAAAGLGVQADKQQKEKEGKCLPETFIEKSAINDANIVIPSYYDFVHGIFRMLNEKLNEKHEPISDLIVYYEQITSYATHHRWPAVFSLHRSMANEVALGMRTWDAEIKHRNTAKHLNVASDLSEFKNKQAQNASQSQGQGQGSNNSSQGQGGDGKKHKIKNRPRIQSDISYTRSQSQFAASDDAPVCRLFNHNERGCTYGGICDYRHVCDICELKGIKALHPAMYCASINARPDRK